MNLVKASHNFCRRLLSLLSVVRFLQQQVPSADQISEDFHFFNTYFYKKLCDALTHNVIIFLGYLKKMYQLFPNALCLVCILNF